MHTDCGHQVQHQVQRPVLPQDRRLQVTQPLPRLDAQLIAQDPAQLPVNAQRIGLASAAVQREHQLCMQLLIERVVGGQRLQLQQQLGVLTERKPGLGQRPDRPQPQLLQPSRLFLQPRQARDVG